MSRKLNRHAMKRRHKAIQKKRYLKRNGCYSSEAVYRHKPPMFADPRNDGYTYWNQFYLSGRRDMARNTTNRRLRAKYRGILSNLSAADIAAISEALEDIRAMRNAEYQQQFDYAWTIW